MLAWQMHGQRGEIVLAGKPWPHQFLAPGAIRKCTCQSECSLISNQTTSSQAECVGSLSGNERQSIAADGLSSSPMAANEILGLRVPHGASVRDRQSEVQVGTDDFIGHMQRLAGPEAVADWRRLQKAMEPYTEAAAAVPSMALRQDPTATLTILGRYLPSLFSSGPAAARLIKPASEVSR